MQDRRKVHKFFGKVINKEVYLLKKVLIRLGPKIEVGNCHPCSNQSDFLICSRNGGRFNTLSGEVVNNIMSLLLRPILGKGWGAISTGTVLTYCKSQENMLIDFSFKITNNLLLATLKFVLTLTSTQNFNK